MTDIASAINQALAYSLEQDQQVLILGEDIGKCGGVFRVTEGLQNRFGEHRVVDTPLSESLLAGMAVGMSTHGLKPIIEFQFMGFLYSALDQIINHLARMRNRTRGNLNCPTVLRMPYGGGIKAPEHHSESTEAILAHIPGLTVVVPSTPQQAYHMLIEAIQCPDPVIFLEPKRIYRSIDQPLELRKDRQYLRNPRFVTQGDDLTIIAWGAALQDVISVNQSLLQQGISAEIIDLVCLSPLDLTTIYPSVIKTGRCLIVHEACQSYGAGAEIGFRIFNKCFNHLLAPVKRLCSPDITIPYFQLEQAHFPQKNDIVRSSIELVEY